MNVRQENIMVELKPGEPFLTNLRWFRGDSRYNNGGTKYGRKYLLRLLIGRIKIKQKER